jgi:hypothetical protein
MSLTPSHISFIKKLRADTGVEDLSVDPKATIAAMDKRYSLSSTRSVLTALRKVYPDNKEFIAEMHNRYQKFRAIDETQEPTEKQEENFVSWDNILDFRKQYYDEMSLTERLLMALYTLIPPVRADYTPMRIVTVKPKKFEDGTNYLVWNARPHFIFHAYKTHNKYGDKIFKIPPPLKKEIAKYMEGGAIDQEYLFEANGEAWTAARLALEVRKIFQKYHKMDTGINLIRHAYLTKYHAGQKPLAELKKTSDAMMHGPMLSQAYRFVSLE